MPKQYLTVNEVARIFGVSPLTVRNWDQKGRLKAHRNPMNNYRLYKIEEVEKLLQEIASSKDKRIFPKNIPENNVVEESSPDLEKSPFRKLKIDME